MPINADEQKKFFSTVKKFSSCDKDSKKRKIDWIKLMYIKNNIDINKKDDNGNTALHLLVSGLQNERPYEYGQIKGLLHLLVELGARTDLENTQGKSPFDIALAWLFSGLLSLLGSGSVKNGITLWGAKLSNFKFKIFCVAYPSGALSKHPDRDISSLNASGG